MDVWILGKAGCLNLGILAGFKGHRAQLGLLGLGELCQPQGSWNSVRPEILPPSWEQPAGFRGGERGMGGPRSSNLPLIFEEMSEESLKSGINASVGLELEGCGSWLCQLWVEAAGA